MKKHLVGIGTVALMTLVGFVGFVIANPDWTPGSPSKAPGPGSIIVQGTFTPSTPYQTTGTVRVNCWPTGGGQKTVTTALVPPGQTGLTPWGPYTISGLASGQQYNFSVEIDVINPGNNATATYQTDTNQQTAP